MGDGFILDITFMMTYRTYIFFPDSNPLSDHHTLDRKVSKSPVVFSVMRKCQSLVYRYIA